MNRTAPADAPADDIAAFIRRHLPLAPVPLIPEIRLHKAVPESGLRRLASTGAGRPAAPYWAYYWAGGLALARHILDTPALVVGRRVLDLGAGSGLVGIAAALAGATRVSASDIDAHAIAAIALNAAANGVEIDAAQGDLTRSAPPDVDMLLVGDLFYEARLARRVTAYLDRCRAAGIQVLVGDPGRAPLPLSRLAPIADHAVAETGTPRTGRVFAFR